MSRWNRLLVGALICGALVGCSRSEERQPYLEYAAITGEQAEQIFDYAYPLVLMQITQDLMFTVPFRDRGYPNKFIMFNELAKPENQAVVLGNRNTLYCVGWVDLSRGPVVFEIPDMGERYFVMPLLDAWTNTFASLGSRTTGQAAQKYLVVLEGSDYEEVEGYTTIVSPTSMVWITGRIQADSPSDADKAALLQNQYVLMTHEESQSGIDPFADYEPSYAAWQVRKPVPYSLDMSAEDFYNEFFDAWQANAPANDDAEMVGLLERAGIIRFDTRDFAKLSDSSKSQLTAALTNKQISYLDAFYRGEAQTDIWTFNVERMGTWGVDYARRAYWAMWGLGANLVEDAVYGVSQLDADLNQMMGGELYRIRFEANELPPTKAFWSVTTYDNEGYLEENAFDRYSLGSNHDLSYNADGSLEIYLSNVRPQGVANWTPTPVDEFKVLLRIYWPTDDVLAGAWSLPPIQRVSQ